LATKGGVNIAAKSRAEYFRKRREEHKQFTVMIEREKLEVFENELKRKNITKVAWFREKVDEELGKK
jgi:hypothetical protein